MPKDFDDESVVFDDAFVAGGIKESSLRRYAAPPPTRPAGVPGRPAGPRDWTPTAPRRRRSWPLAAIFAALAVLLGFLVTRHHSSGPVPIAAPTSTPPSAGASPSAEPQVGGMDALSIGDCFSVVGTGSDQSVQPHDCSTRHTYQLVQLERAEGSDDRYPAESYWDGPVAKRCEQDVLTFTRLPEDRWPVRFASAQFRPVRAGWAAGDRRVYCAAEWLRGGVGSARHLTARPAGAVITAPRAQVLSGVLGVVQSTQQSCLVLDAGGRRTAIESADGTFTAGIATVNGVLDRAHSGLFRGVATNGALPVRRVGESVRLTGSPEPDPAGIECGARTVFRFTTLH